MIFVLAKDTEWVLEMPGEERFSQIRAERHPDDIVFFAELVPMDVSKNRPCEFCTPARWFTAGQEMAEHNFDNHKEELEAKYGATLPVELPWRRKTRV